MKRRQTRKSKGNQPCKGWMVVRLVLAIICMTSVRASQAQTLSITPGVSALTIHPGDTNVAIPVSVSASGAYAGAITVTLTGLPSGMSVTPAVMAAGGSGTVYLSASVAADQEAFSPLLLPAPGAATSTIQAVAIGGTAQASSPISLTVSLANPAFMPKTVDLPVVQINTSGAAVNSKTVDVPGTITITSADGSTTYLPNSADPDNTATFHVHGNTTALMPKLPYNVKLNTGFDLLADLGLTCPYVTTSGKPVCDKSKSYILLANYDDKTMLRDWAASALANAIPYGGKYLSPTPVPLPNKGTVSTPSGTKTPMPWAPHSLFVELYLNGAYQGTYQLIEEVKVDSHRVNIPELAQTQVNGDLSGGYLLEIDQHQDEDFVFITPQGLPIGLTDPNFSPEVPEQTSYISNYVDTAENALFSSSFQDPAKGWRAYFDQASAVNYYIVNDLMGNVDGGDFFSSVYLYKAPDNPFLYMGPVWDFDISSGNVNYSSIVDPTVAYTTVQAPWFAQWFKDPSFKAAARQQWNALKSQGVLTSWLSSISAEASTLQQAQTNNFGRWPMQGIQVWPNPQAGGSYSAEVNYLLSWLTLRMGYIDKFLNGLPTTATVLSASQSSVGAPAPVTLTAKVSGNNPTGVVIFSYNSVVLGQATLTSAGTASLTTSSIPTGSWQISAAYGGDSNNALSLSSTVALTVQPVLVQTVVNLNATASSPAFGSPVTLTVAVAGTQGSATPTGSVAFVANGVTLGTAQIASGVAVLSTSNLPLGNSSVQARYSGDTSYAASASNAIQLQTIGDFALVAPTPAVETIAAGTLASITLSLSPLQGAFPGDVTLTLSGVPSNVTCALSPAMIPAAAGAQQIVLTCTAMPILHSAFSPRQGDGRFLLLSLLVLPLPLLGGRTSRNKLMALLLCAGVSGMAVGLVGCGSGSNAASTSPVSSDVVVTASAAGLQHSATVPLKVTAGQN